MKGEAFSVYADPSGIAEEILTVPARTGLRIVITHVYIYATGAAYDSFYFQRNGVDDVREFASADGSAKYLDSPCVFCGLKDESVGLRSVANAAYTARRMQLAGFYVE